MSVVTFAVGKMVRFRDCERDDGYGRMFYTAVITKYNALQKDISSMAVVNGQ